jgi:hypothetical protein
MINEPDQKAVVFYHKGEQQLIISPSFEGAPSEFAWIIPVPARPKVQVLDGAIFHELARLTTPPPPRVNVNGKKGEAAGDARASVSLIERKIVGAYDVSVLEATDGGALARWLRANGYPIPDKARAPISQYVREKWTFVACRVRNPGASRGLRTGTLAAIRLTFKTTRPVYPMRISSANPSPFQVLVYLVLPRSESGGDRDGGVLNVTGPGLGVRRHGSRWRASLEMFQRSSYPTLRTLAREPLDVYVAQTSLRPQESNRDYVWQTRGKGLARR